MRTILFLLCICSTVFAVELSKQSYLMSFPEIGYDDHKAVFSNDTWSAVFSGQAGVMFTVPRDSIELPKSDQEGRGCRVVVGNATYVCNPVRGNSIVKQDAYGNTDKTITPPNSQAMEAFADAWKKVSISRAEVTEEIGPLFAADKKVWFGLLAFYGAGHAPIAGLGWYDSSTDQFGRVYAPELIDLAPRWLGVRQDTVWVFCNATGADVGGKLITYSIRDGALGLVDPRAAGMLGDTLLNVGLWKGNLLLATENSVCVWPRGESAWVWQTSAYASREASWLKFLTFDTEQGLKNIGDDFFPLQKNRPAQAFAQVGDWLLLLAPNGIEATMPTSAWKKRKNDIDSPDWGCEDKLCFARVRVSVDGVNKEMDLLDTPLILLDEGELNTKIGMRAGWAPVYQVVPVLIKK